MVNVRIVFGYPVGIPQRAIEYDRDVGGTFGDYQDDEDVEKNFQYRWLEERKRLEAIAEKKPGLDFEASASRLRSQIAKGEYAMWENVWLWRELGWDGAWTVEHDNRNLIVGKTATIRMIGIDPETTKRKQIFELEKQIAAILETMVAMVGNENRDQVFDIIEAIEDRGRLEPDLLVRAQFELEEIKSAAAKLSTK